ncbi:MAG: ATPase [Ignavibacteria bacterium GWB2_35_12]|nr:MAG: ATPase [Ignavibacteria bacterium GWA2_35_8]OGU40258.1 MAG: ATPase [Ignavibacteria bacterium GWB2_35_12]OGU90999.1 MAG: ATPase [Ignavibacteria bacterium RIFOXYA2_FULL_35_10]OGV22704.1 MAG: ATPase [Ignavibacteria bacterium RIFOXYC2_FULL_35_21]
MSKQNTLISISENLIIERLKFENPWWITREIDEDINKFNRRLYFNLFYPLVEETSVNRAVVLMGPRRVGKTVMMLHTIQYLLEKGIEQKKICYVNTENPVYNNLGLEKFFNIIRQATSENTLTGWYIFFDEIQYLKDWEIHLKVLVDSYPKSKFIVSGSAAAALKMKSTESGTGRFTDFMLPPLTFCEYIHLKKLDKLLITEMEKLHGKISRTFKAQDINELNKHFIDYINFGGYPEVIFSPIIQQNPGRYIRSDIVDKVLLRDLPSLYGIQDVQELNTLFTMLAYNSGNEISLNDLSKNSGVEKHLLKKYLLYLETAFLIKIVHRVDDNSRKFKRANYFKIYLTNTSIRSALFTPIQVTDDMMGYLIETAIYSQWLHDSKFFLSYARWQKGEVDMVYLNEETLKPRWAVEIKWSNHFFNKPGDLKSLIYFCKRNKLDSAFVTTIDKEGIIEIQGIKFYFEPASIYAYTVGKNIIEKINTD